MSPFGKKKKKDKSSDALQEKTEKKLGQRIGGLYLKAMRNVMQLVESRPDVQELKPKVSELKENTIQELIKLGEIRKSMDTSQKAIVNMDITSEMRKMDKNDFQVFSDVINHYRSLDNDLANLIADFNIITQYADFELLKKQNPKEFKRLGLGE